MINADERPHDHIGSSSECFDNETGESHATTCTTRRSNLCSPHHLRTTNGGDFQWKSRAFVFLPKDHRNQQSGFDRPDLRVIVRMRDIELSDDGYQERLHLNDTAKRLVFSVPEERMIYSN